MAKSLTNRVNIVVALTMFVFSLILAGCSNNVDNTQGTTEDVPDEYQASTVLSTEKVSENNCFSEKEVSKFLQDRGFSGEITTSYTIDGSYFSERQISDSDEKHPTYSMIFTTDTKIWSILVQGKEVYATQVEQGAIYSEEKYINSYYSQNNSFYKIIPTTVAIKTVDEISAVYLASL